MKYVTSSLSMTALPIETSKWICNFFLGAHQLPCYQYILSGSGNHRSWDKIPQVQDFFPLVIHACFTCTSSFGYIIVSLRLTSFTGSAFVFWFTKSYALIEDMKLVLSCLHYPKGILYTTYYAPWTMHSAMV